MPSLSMPPTLQRTARRERLGAHQQPQVVRACQTCVNTEPSEGRHGWAGGRRATGAASFLDCPLVYRLQLWGTFVRTVVSWCTTLASVWATVSHPPPDNDCVLACMVHVWPFFPVLLVVGSILHCRLCCDGGFERRWRRGRRTCSILVRGREDGVRCARLESTCACGGWIGCPVVKVLGDKEAQDGNLAARDTSDDINSVRAAGAHQALQIIGRFTYCCLPNFGRCGLSQDRLSVNCPLVEQLYPAE